MTMQGDAQQIGHTDAAVLHARRQAGEDVQIVDVREPYEHAQGVIEGAILMPMGDVRTRWQEIDTTRPVHVICHLGGRSATVAGFLVKQGLQAVNVDDGMDGWERRALPTVGPS